MEIPTPRSVDPPTSGPVLLTSVIVCVYTELRWDDIVAGVLALDEGVQPPDEVLLIVDHNPTLSERLASWIGESGLDRVSVHDSTGPRGLSGARNTGIARARGAIVAFLDDDALPDRAWLDRLSKPLLRSGVAVVGGRATPVWPGGVRPRWFPPEFDWVVGSSYVGLPEVPTTVRNVIGCSMAFRREVFEHVGVFIDGIGRVGVVPKGCEETELCIRVGQRTDGGPTSVWFEPSSLVHHRVSADRVRARYFVSRCRAEGQSKAEIGRLIGRQDGTSSERAYVRNVLPAGIGRGLSEFLRGDVGGLGRSVMIAVGLCATTAGYVAESLRDAFRRSRSE